MSQAMNYGLLVSIAPSHTLPEVAQKPKQEKFYGVQPLTSSYYVTLFQLYCSQVRSMLV